MANRQVLVTAGLVELLIAAIILLPLFDPWKPDQMAAADVLAPRSIEHLLGTDQFGREVLSRIASGGVISLTVGVMVTECALLAGVLIGGLAGFLGGWTDIMLMRGMDALLPFPGILLALALVAALTPGFSQSCWR